MSLKDQIYKFFPKVSNKADIPVEVIEGIVKAEMQKHNEELFKANAVTRKEAFRYMLPYGWNQRANADKKMGSNISMLALRLMANSYPIARACINRRVRQITQLEWNISPVDPEADDNAFTSQIEEIKTFFKQPMGHKTRMREMLTIMVDDTLTLDALCFEMQRRINGGFMYLIPVDPTTIILRLEETGATPAPPEIAYAQYIRGVKVAEFTTNEMLYESMNSRSYNPYGLAPLETLFVQVESAMRGALYNLKFFTDGTVPEGFLTLPEDIANSPDEIREWQEWFDAIMAGDTSMMRRLKVLPNGSEYMPSKKPEDMAFERFEIWLLQQTCAVFDVQPQDIGITLDVNRSTAESQTDIGNERGLYPLANYIKEILDDIIQVEFGYTDLQFTWTDIDPSDHLNEASIAEKEIKLGALSVDEYRADQGRDPVGLGHYIMTSKGPVLVADIINGTYTATPDDVGTDPVDKAEEEIKELRKWRKCLYNDIDSKSPLRIKFVSDKIRPEIKKEIMEGLKNVTSKIQIKYLFDLYVDPQVKNAMKLLEMSSRLSEDTDEFS